MIFHDIKQNTEEWEALRVAKVTASNFGKFMANDGKSFGEPAMRYALQIALERITGNKSGSDYSNEHMDRGHDEEPIARLLYEEQNFVDVRNGGFFDCGLYGDSPDGLVGDGDGVIEIKAVIEPTHYATLKRGSFDPSYRWQLIGHLDCTGCDWVEFISYCAKFPLHNQLIIHRLYRKDYADEIARLRARRTLFLVEVDKIETEIK